MPRPKGEHENPYIRLARVIESQEAPDERFAQELEDEIQREFSPRGGRNDG